MESVRIAKEIAIEAHKGQVDKGGNDYILHLQAVADQLTTESQKVVAWLHDTVEDTNVTLGYLEAFGFGDEVINAIDAITKRKGESRKEYINRVSNNPLATIVKIADLKNNSDLSRINNRPVTNEDINRSKRYKKEMKWLIRRLQS